MAQKCLGCNRLNIPLFTWLAGDNLCASCKSNPFSPEVNVNFKKNLEEGAAGRKREVVLDEQRVATFWGNAKLVFGVLLAVFALWVVFGGLLEDQGAYNAKNTVNIDCTQPGWQNSPYCNGSYDSQVQEQDAQENNYYQNSVR